MEVIFTKSFEKSLEKLVRQNGWIYKSYSILRYDIWIFFANIWRFRKVLWNHRWFDYRYTLESLYVSLSIMEKKFSTQGYEIAISKDKKVDKMRRSLFLLKNKLDDNYVDRAEDVLGKIKHYDMEFEDAGNGCSRLVDKQTPEERAHSRNVYDYATKLEKDEWVELWDIFKGQGFEEYEKYVEDHKSDFTQKQIDDGDAWNSYFDGSGFNGWWD